MNITPTKLDGVVIIEPDVFTDDRGWFFESYNQAKFKALGIETVFVQDNHSLSSEAGVLRGLHFQNPPKAQTKLVRCTYGALLDVVVDLRKNSPTFKQWFSIELTAENKKMLYVPAGCAHGFLTLEPNSELQYKVDNHYSKEHDRSIRWNDPEIGIDWGISDPILADKDRNAPLLSDSDADF